MESRKRCRLLTSSKAWARMQSGEEQEEMNLLLRFKVDEKESWVSSSTNGASTSVVSQRESSGPWRIFATTVSNPLRLRRLDRFIHRIILKLGVPDEYAFGIRVDLLSDVGNGARLTRDRGFKNLQFDIEIGPETEHHCHMALQGVPAAEAATSRNAFKKEMEGWNDTCVICLEDFVEDTKVNQLACLHTFHGTCIMNWLRQSISCPICRFRLRDEV